MPTTDSPLRYPGGKTQLTPFVVELLRANNLKSAIYAEPFAGGAGLALRLLFSGHVSEIWLNDIDPAVHALWKCILEHPDDLCERVQTTPVTMREWTKQRARLDTARRASLDLAFAVLFLNRTNRSGIIRGGVIGGKNQRGTYKIDCRFNRSELISKIRRISSYRDVVKVSRMDAGLCIPIWSKTLPKRALLGIDPPYYVQGRELYTNFYTHDSHKALARIIRKLKCAWLLTYDNSPEVAALYAGLPIYCKELTYYAQQKRRASELLILAPTLIPPTDLAKVSADAA